MSHKRRILFVSEAVTLAHVARPLALATKLEGTAYTLCFACDSRYDSLLGQLRFDRAPLTSIESRRFFQALARGRPLYDLATLTDYVEEDRRLLNVFRPDVVIGDFRLSLGVSARIEAVPYINLSNAYWSPLIPGPLPVPDIPLAHHLGLPLAQRLFNLARPLAFSLHALPMNRLRKRYGLPPLPADVRHAYCDGDYTLFADLPELYSEIIFPENQHFIGHLPWSPKVPLPEWWNDLPEGRPCIYVTLGSSGPRQIMLEVLKALAEFPGTALLATAGHKPDTPLPGNVFHAPFLPGEAAVARADLVLCNGGSPTSYQALAAGKPVIGLAGNLDQQLNMSRIEAAGAGIRLHAAAFSKASLLDTLNLGLSSSTLRDNACRLSRHIDRLDPLAKLESLLDHILIDS